MSLQVRRVSSLFITAPVLLAVGAVLLPALLYKQNDLTILCFLVFGVIGSLRLWGSAGLLSLACTAGVDRRRLFPGESFVIDASVENRKVLPVWVEVRVPVAVTGADVQAAQVLNGEGGILWYGLSGFSWKVSVGKRGVYRIGPAKLTSGDLFGFFPKEKEVKEVLEVIVYPRLVPLRSLPLFRRDFFGLAGAHGPVKDPVYILGTTDYYHGSPARFIHWKASARHHRLQEKVFEPSEQEKILIVVDVEGFESEGEAESFERTLEAAASLAAQLDRKGTAVGLLTNGVTVGGMRSYLRVTRSGAQLSEVLELLARLEARARLSMVDVLGKNPALPYGVSCVYFAFEETEGRNAALEKLKSMRISVRPVVSKDVGRLTTTGNAGSCDGAGYGNLTGEEWKSL